MTRIVLIGSGNLAYHLAMVLHRIPSWEVILVSTHGLKFSPAFDSIPVTKLIGIESLPSNADYYGLCISDDALQSFKMPVIKHKSLVFHLSGSQSISVLKNFSNYCGVLYPVYSFSKEQSVNWNEVPILIESLNVVSLEMIKKLAYTLSNNVSYLSSENRRVLHLSAVFANNFINHMLHISDAICKEHEIPADLLQPLIQQTFQKAKLYGAQNAQTGPARRLDTKLMNLHIEMLKNSKEWQLIYKSVSESIQKTYE